MSSTSEEKSASQLRCVYVEGSLVYVFVYVEGRCMHLCVWKGKVGVFVAKFSLLTKRPPSDLPDQISPVAAQVIAIPQSLDRVSYRTLGKGGFPPPNYSFPPQESWPRKLIFIKIS